MPSQPEMSYKNDASYLAVPTAHKSGYLFTHFNYTEEIITAIRECGSDYGVFQEEKCPTTGNMHLQGYLHWKNKKKGSELIRKFPGAQWRVARAGPDANTVYCSKPETLCGLNWTWGVKPMDQQEKGKSGGDKIKEKYKFCLDNARMGDFDAVEERYPDVMFLQKDKLIRAFNDHADKIVPKTHQGELEGVWIVGDAGSGKSASARAMAVHHYASDDPFIKPCNTHWWTGYMHQTTVILDDLDPTCKTMSHDFKTWIDRYKVNVRIHHGSININPKNFIVTSQYEIDQCWDDPKVVAAMTRRFPTVIRMTLADGDKIREDCLTRLITPEQAFGDDL